MWLPSPSALLARASLRATRAFMQVRHRRDFESVRRFVMFAGYPRSGHSIVGACLDAHRHAVIAHELDAAHIVLAGRSRSELFARALERAREFERGGSRGAYDYRVPHQWQGRLQELRVIGDKRGGGLTRGVGGGGRSVGLFRWWAGVLGWAGWRFGGHPNRRGRGAGGCSGDPGP